MLAFDFEFSVLWVTERLGCTVVSAVFFSTHVCFEVSFEVPFDFFDFTFRSLTPSFFSAVFNQSLYHFSQIVYGLCSDPVMFSA